MGIENPERLRRDLGERRVVGTEVPEEVTNLGVRLALWLFPPQCRWESSADSQQIPCSPSF